MAPLMKIVAITGGSGAGKTTIARALKQRLGQGAVMIAEDDYYRCASTLKNFDPATYNFDVPAAKDHALLGAHLAAARRGEGFDKPIYDLATHRRRPESEHIAGAETLIVEGIHLLADADLRALFALKVFVEADEALRLGRRMIRDVEERGRTPQSVFDQFFLSVRPMHEAHVAPQKSFADLVLRCEYGAAPQQSDANAARIQAALTA
jgi:uridine kinase